MIEDFDVTQFALLGEAADCLQGVAIFVWDDDRNYVAVNQAACELLGKRRDEILSMRVGDMTANRASPLFEQMLRGGVHAGAHTFDGGSVSYVTTQTRIAGLVYQVSICWPPAAE